MQLPIQTLRVLLDYHYDRRERVYDFMATLPPEQFVRELGDGWGGIRNTLIHCLFAEEFWVQHALQGRPRPSMDFAAYADVAAVRRCAAAVRDRTESYIATLSDAELARETAVTFSSGTTVRFPVCKALLHVITHDTHHRGQVMLLARQLGHEPPEIDLL